MNEIDPILEEFPAESRQVVEALWRSLPAESRRDLLALIPALPGDPGKVQKLFKLAHQQLQMSFGDKHEVAIIGPANVGKSTLYNRLVAAKADRAEVGPVPGTTRANQAASAGPFTIVDTPGADAVGLVGERERELALDAAAAADFLVIMFDAVQGVKQTEQQLFRRLEALHKPFIVVLNKMDLLKKKEAQRVVAKVAENLEISVETVIAISAEKGEGVEEVVLAIVKGEPALVAALGQGLPAYRWQLAWRVISGAASTAGLVALTPLPFIDFLPLVGIQVSLVLGIARIYNYKMTVGRARELISTLGAGFLARTLFAELSKLGGPPTWMVAAGVAAGGTVAIGYGAVLWFDRGERLTREATGEIARTVSAHLIDAVRNIGQRRPSRQQLSERLQEALAESPLAPEGTRLEETDDE
jgi:small GTP-binding protein